MNELQQKLSKRRTYVEESGLKFESQPAAHEAVMGTPSSPYKTCAAPPKHCGVGVDFQAAISRRRATVDGDGETFESTPSVKTADAVASPALSMSPPGFVPKGGSADFKKVIDQQRATVDEGAKTFESLPAERTADCVSSIRSETMQVPLLAEKFQAQDAQDELTDADGTPHGADVDAEDDGDESDGASQAHADPEEPTKTVLTVTPARVSWLVGLSHPLAAEYHSDSFAIKDCEPVHLRLETLDGGCRLSVQAPEGVEQDLQVKLFVGKGWRKKAFRTWNGDSASIVEDFGTDLTHRNSILCGVIFKAKVARQV
ncbi:unnamed protein product [Cladocopium goreaui]|uniref:Ferredoxin--NADP(+) reductase n=1 Tax=Cladocopium goreaui TaxID=2562237 RepID=A0A9P1FT85_9DINO|nr:unnamed protein product [Cladocopium goreaui]|mmetsp:Transcript_76567/g.169210  ORF Transcript_76567/g.169210 Transcript_76567/m.169210 type:complete len:315 (+) Transcript_76567:66-1010(+)